MPSQWGRQPTGMDSRKLVFGIIVIGIIGYLLLPNLFKGINSSIDPATVPASNLDNSNLPNTYDPYASNTQTPSSSGYSAQNFLNNSLDNSKSNDPLSTGYWIIFLYNGAIQQLPVNAQDYAFVQSLVNSDTKGSSANLIYLVENGQIHQYNVSNETYSILSNLETIKKRSSDSLPISDQSPSSSSTSPGISTPGTTNPSTTVPGTTAPSTTTPSTAAPNTTNPSTSTPNAEGP